MDSLLARAPSRRTLPDAPSLSMRALGAWLLPFVLVLYLALEGGGYDPIVQGEVGIAIWWVLLVGVVAGVLPVVRLGRLGFVALGLLAAFTAWTALGIGWSESAERGWSELAHVATLLGILALALAAQGTGATRHFLNGLTAAIAVVGLLAILSRLQPQLFPANELAEFFPDIRGRLNYPLNYWNALAAFIAIGLPLVAKVMSTARTLVAQALAGAALPALVLAIYFTSSRGGAAAAVVGLLAFVVITPNRATKLASLALASAGSALLVAGAAQRTALQDGLLNETARRQGDEMLTMLLVVCTGVALLQVALGLALRYGVHPRLPAGARRLAPAALIASLFAAGSAAFAAGAAGEISDRWEQFRNPAVDVAGADSNRPARFTSASGNGRYQYWQSALDAAESEPFHGIGPGSYEFWWARNATLGGKIRRAHSLIFETLAELGVVGLALLSGFLALVLGAGTARALRGAGCDGLAAATAGCAAFTVAAAVDWTWEVTAVPAAFLVLAAVVLGGRDAANRKRAHRGPAAPRVRAAVAVLSVTALVAIALPLAGTSFTRDSQAHFSEAQLGPALEDARTAESIQPYAATPRLQHALVLERSGRLREAATAARSAAGKESTNWGTWLVLSRIEAKRARANTSIRAYRKARALNPLSPLFTR